MKKLRQLVTPEGQVGPSWISGNLQMRMAEQSASGAPVRRADLGWEQD